MSELLDHMTIRLNGEDREIFMSFGLVRDLNRAFPNPNDPVQVFHNPHQFENALWLLLADRSPTGKLLAEEFDLDEQDMDPDDAVALVRWGMEHLMRFFLKKLGQVPTLGEASVAQMEALLSAFPGLKGLASTSVFAGPTESNEAGSESSTNESPTET